MIVNVVRAATLTVVVAGFLPTSMLRSVGIIFHNIASAFLWV